MCQPSDCETEDCYNAVHALPAGYRLTDTEETADHPGSFGCFRGGATNWPLPEFTLRVTSFRQTWVLGPSEVWATASEIVGAVDAVILDWTSPIGAPAPDFTLTYEEDYVADDSSPPVHGNGISEIGAYWGSSDLNPASGTIAQYDAFGEDDAPCHWSECDITLFGQSPATGERFFDTSEPPLAGTESFRFALAHELGHCIGLGHNDPTIFAGTIMVAGIYPGTQYPAPSDEDIAAAVYIFGEK